MPCHNASRFLRATLVSILGQSWSDFELLLVDDGSNDNPEAIVKSIGDPRVRCTRIPHSGGPSRPRNVGLELARGRLIFFFDADDVMLPAKLERQVAMFERRPDLSLCFTDFQVIDETDRVITPSFLDGYQTFARLRKQHLLANDTFDPSRLRKALLRANFIGTSGVAVRAETMREVGPFDETLASSEDRDLWLRIAQGHACGYLDIIGHAYRRHPDSLMQQFSDRHPRARIAVFERQLALANDHATRRIISAVLAENHCSLGFIHERFGDPDEARRHYLGSLRLRPRPSAFWGWLKCALLRRRDRRLPERGSHPR
jgi:glycosyltransferase involved in cell wall biosynthesis